MYLKEIQLYMSRAYGPGSYDASYEKQGRDYPLPTCAGPRIATWRSSCGWPPRVGSVRPLITHEFPWTKRRRRTTQSSIRRRRAWRCCCAIRHRRRRDPVGGIRSPRKVAITGCGPAPKSASNSPWWARAIWPSGNTFRIHQEAAGVGLRAVYSAGRGKRQELRASASAPRMRCSEYEEVSARCRGGCVLIASRNQHHAAQSLAALRAGKHVFVEKPMALTAAGVRRTLRRGRRERQAAHGGLQSAIRALSIAISRRI